MNSVGTRATRARARTLAASSAVWMPLKWEDKVCAFVRREP